MSFIYKQMLNNIITDNEALWDEVNQLILKNIYYGFRVCGTTYQNCYRTTFKLAIASI